MTIAVFLIVLFACGLGSVSGLGGGLIIKPLMDATGAFSVAAVSAMSSLTVLTMTIVSLLKSRQNSRQINWRIVIFFIVGSLIGGVIGNSGLSMFLHWANDDAFVTIIQSVLQIVLVVLVLINECFGQHIPHYHVKNPVAIIFAGLALGGIASFLSIGGGPFNRPVLIILLSISSKSAVFISLCIIFFSQISNVITMGLTTHFANIEPSILPVMIVAAILGGYIGGYLATRVKDKLLDRFFIMTLFIILGINIFNLVGHL